MRNAVLIHIHSFNRREDKINRARYLFFCLDIDLYDSITRCLITVGLSIRRTSTDNKKSQSITRCQVLVDKIH